ncbi:piRNA biogenesis protein EXD1-like [Schistocerca piceifrons]|uniref:piRNA biogenesis protein EXD1-like n=1 Tax=Schistocerca piceifrons TaxID=274613 RepID=UPI001F5F2B4D|nr:piRNA biogenesis protein EXD1-like [Schistocerca piceifrons]
MSDQTKRANKCVSDCYMDGFVKGQILLVKTKEGNLRGCFHSISDDCSILTLTDVKWLPMEDPVDGLFHINCFELLSIRILEPGNNAASSKENKSVCNFKLMRHVPPPTHPGRDVGNVTECDVVPNYNPFLLSGNPSWGKSLKKLDDTIRRLCVVTEKYIFVDDAETFEAVVEHLEMETIIALEFEGVTFGVWRKIRLINIATWQRTFLLDLRALDSVLFIKKMKGILESEYILKVIHNCRLISAILLQDYSIMLKNVFDTQVADLCVALNKYQELPLFVRSLPDCLNLYLDLPEVLIHRSYVRDGYIDTDLSSWMNRPLHLALQQEAVKNGVFLLLLHDKHVVLSDEAFKHGCNIYLSIGHKMKKSEIAAYLPKIFMVPSDMLEVMHMVRGGSGYYV